MSFFSGNRQGCNPGPISGSPLNGLCEKACIQTRKVFDACMQQTQLNDVILNITNLTPANPTYPLTFVSGESSCASAAASFAASASFGWSPVRSRPSPSPLALRILPSSMKRWSGKWSRANLSSASAIRRPA